MKGLGFRALGLGLCVLGFGLKGSVPLRQKDAGKGQWPPLDGVDCKLVSAATYSEPKNLMMHLSRRESSRACREVPAIS